jgi:hypothetical protein
MSDHRFGAPPPQPLPRAHVPGRASLVAPLIAAALLPPGWMFIAHAHRWHLTPSVIVLCLAWAAVVGAGYTLVRAGNALLDEVPDDWFTAGGTHAELEREKKSLVRAIKEIEFDRDTGKLSAADAAALLGAYRGRAIEVIKVLDQGATGLSPRERVLAELKARAQVDRQAGKAKAKAAKAGKGGKTATAAVTEAATATAAVTETVTAPEAATATVAEAVTTTETETPAAVIEARATDAASPSEEVAS